MPSWSPNGSSILFTANGMLRTVNLETGTARSLCETDVLTRGTATWSVDDVILFPTSGGLHRVAAGGGECRPVPQGSDQAGREFPRFSRTVVDISSRRVATTGRVYSSATWIRRSSGK